MAAVDNVTRTNIPIGNVEIVRAQLTGTTSTFVSKFGKILSCVLNEEGTNGATYTWSTRTVTITGTNDDYVNIIIVGRT